MVGASALSADDARWNALAGPRKQPWQLCSRRFMSAPLTSPTLGTFVSAA